MKLARDTQILTVRGLAELSTVNGHHLRDAINDALTPDLEAIEVDLSETRFVDSSGLGALVSLYQTLDDGQGGHRPTVRLLRPPPAVRQVLELTGMHHVFEITSHEPINNDPPAIRATAVAAIES